MKHLRYLLVLGAILASFLNVQANDFLELSKHYSCYATGAGVLHFKIPVWSYGSSYDYYACDESYVWYKVGDVTTKIFYFKSDPYEENKVDDGKGTAYVKLEANQGSVIVTSLVSGIKQSAPAGSWTSKMLVTQTDEVDNDNDEVTWLEVDWYTPASLDGKAFSVGVEATTKRSYTAFGENKHTWSTSWSGFTGAECMMTPLTFDPYLYMVGDGGITGYGYAAVPYATFYTPISYTTSYSDMVIRTTDRSGNMFVMTNDTVQENFYANIRVWRDEKNQDAVVQKTTSIDIPPYHRIYDFTATEEVDETGTFTGSNILRWHIKNPLLRDIVEDDYFEVQRAFKQDFSDARQITVIPMRRDNSGAYELIDDSRQTWTGNAEIKTDTIKATVEHTAKDFILRDGEGFPLYQLDVKLSTNKAIFPSVPVYYRIRRASSSVWGWNEEEFYRTYQLNKVNYLAPLAAEQPPYTLDPDYENNHKVNFKFKIENSEITSVLPPQDLFELSYTNSQSLKEVLTVHTDYFFQNKYNDDKPVKIEIYEYGTGAVTKMELTEPKDFTVIKGSKIYVDYPNYNPLPGFSNTVIRESKKFTINDDCVLHFEMSKNDFYDVTKVTLQYGLFATVITDYQAPVVPPGTGAYISFHPKITITDSDGNVIVDKVILKEPKMYSNIPTGSKASVTYTYWDAQRKCNYTHTKDFVIKEDAAIRFKTIFQDLPTRANVIDVAMEPTQINALMRMTEADRQHLKDSLYAIISQEYQATTFGKCMWDKTAHLVLVRTDEETGKVSEFMVPQDSITRLEDGSWIASFSDYADQPCTHYKYAVRIDQSKSDLRVHKPDEQLVPIELTGPDLYFDDAAKITSFTATKDDAVGEMKRGVLLNWTASSSAVDEFLLQRKELNSDDAADTVYMGLENSFFDQTAIPSKNYEYTITAFYNCNGKNTENYATTEGVRSKYGEISGSVLLTDNSGMNGVTVALQGPDGNTIRTMQTDATGRFKFDSLEYDVVASTAFSVVPTSAYGVFSYNNTSAGTASITMSANNAMVSGLEFVNTASVRLTGRVLYKNSTIPVAGAMFLLNNDTIRRGNAPLTTAIDGTFEIIVPQRQPCKLQVFKTGHQFEGDGILRVEGDEEVFSLTKPLDGVRFYDETKVRLVGRVAGGNDQRDLPQAFGLGKNNLGDDLQLVLQLEGDNTAHFVHDPNDLTRDTVMQKVEHTLYKTSATASTVANADNSRVVGQTNTLFEKKRIIIQPDIETGEFQVDLFPVKYKVVQTTAKGYATLFASGSGSDVVDLTNASLTDYTAVYDHDKDSVLVNISSSVAPESQQSVAIPWGSEVYDGDSTHYNALYNRIYHNPVQVELTQLLYGLEREGYGEPSMEVSNINPDKKEKINLYAIQDDGTVRYTLGYPLFYTNRKYQYKAKAYENYFYNNDSQSGTLDRVPWRGGSVTVRNGMHNTTDSEVYKLDEKGMNGNVWLMVDDIDVESAGEGALRTVSVALETEGSVVETNVFRGFIVGSDIHEKELISTTADIQLLDIIRDPGGAGSSAYVEAGTTYKFGFNTQTKATFGIELKPTWGLSVTSDIGIVAAPAGTGSYTGSTFNTSKAFSFSIPISHTFDFGSSYEYSVTTKERIETSSSPGDVGSGADVFVGATMSQLAGKAKTVAVIDDSLFQMRQPAIEAGAMLVLAEGVDENGQTYHLVTGQKVVQGLQLDNTFTYTQNYILGTVIPNLALQRQNLLMSFNSAEEAQAAANAYGKPTYWYHETENYMQGVLPKMSYEMFVPEGDGAFNDEIAAYNNMIMKWITILIQNEREKVEARTSGMKIGAYSVSDGTSYSYSDSYEAEGSYNELPQGWALIGSDAMGAGGTAAGTAIGSVIANISNFKDKSATFGTSAAEALKNFYTQDLVEGDDGELTLGEERQKNKQELGTVTNSSKFKLDFDPIKNMDSDKRMTTTGSSAKESGFTIVPDSRGDITVSVYRAAFDSTWLSKTEEIRTQVGQEDNNDLKYGSYVFFTEAGASACPHEDVERTRFYNEGTIIGNGTLWTSKPGLSANVFEIANVGADKRATFRIELRNDGEVDNGDAAEADNFFLSFDGTSNPDGAKLYVNGAPLIQNISYRIAPGTPVIQTLEVERGTVDDYNDLALRLGLQECPATGADMNLSVHFLPISSDVEISSPRQNWVMNTLSPQDSVGYYLPIDITGFDIHHKNFDHIEFQYKLSTQSDDNWVNQCSFYAEDSLYQLATGSKAMIENGRIVPFRFYGERDPMEQKYDLRAVSFCRYGSGFVTKASEVISGTKDTRVPVLFGKPQPVSAVLGIEDDLKLRFSEPIAGNYLDEDNNFQLVGVTNETGITAGTSLHFDGEMESFVESKVNRSLDNTSFSIDVIIKPEDMLGGNIFSYSDADNWEDSFTYGIVGNQLAILSLNGYALSKEISSPITDFVRVVMTYDNEEKQARFYLGTEDITNYDSEYSNHLSDFAVNGSALVNFGQGFKGNMLEARIWNKVLTQEEIAATNMRRLTGYEQGLLAYYPMNEGRGTELTDMAHGATLYTKGTAWNLPKGISLALDNTEVELDGNLLARSSIYDETLMFWFKTESSDAPVFTAGRVENDSVQSGTWIGFESGKLVLKTGDQKLPIGSFADNEWHHLVLSINRTYNNAAVYIDGQLTNNIAATKVSGITGAMALGGEGFKGSVDEFTVFEQALPQNIVEDFDNVSPAGDEMGLIAYLPFEEQILNANGILELVFSPNDQRVFKDANGNVVDKVVPLILDAEQSNVASLADKDNYAPVRDHGLLSKLNFSWTYDNSELLINLNMLDREINKQNIYVTVRDVEDLNGNPMPSPVMWTAFVDRNSLKWDTKSISIEHDYDWTEEEYNYVDVEIHNNVGMRHQYTIESVPAWLEVDQPYGSLDPLQEKTIRLTYNKDLPIGEYSTIIYLTDETGLAEPLLIDYSVIATCPWDEVDRGEYDNSMSLRGQVQIISADNTTRLDADTRDIIAVFSNNEMIGKTHNMFDNNTNKSYVYLTIYGNSSMESQPLTIKLWRASTGKIYTLNPSVALTYKNNSTPGYVGEPVALQMTESSSEMQNIHLNKGWNWVSWNVNPEKSSPNDMFTGKDGFANGDLIKSPSQRAFSEFVNEDGNQRWAGSLTQTDFHNMHMMYVSSEMSINVDGRSLTEEQREVTLNKGWNTIAYLLDEPTSLRDALADYFDDAQYGDVIKSKDAVAVFSQEGRWEGSLQSMRPGQGYLFYRNGETSVNMHYYKPSSVLKSGEELAEDVVDFVNPMASGNMTLVAKIDGQTNSDQRVLAYVGTELAGISQPQEIDGDTLYFITVSPTTSAEVSFKLEENGEIIGMTQPLFNYVANHHHGTLENPVLLDFGANSVSQYFPADVRFYTIAGKFIGEVKQAESEQQVQNYLNSLNVVSGMYNAVINSNGEIITLKLIKK